MKGEAMKGKDVPPTSAEVRQACEDLIEMGLLIDSGRKRRARSGEMQTVWVTREIAASMGLKLPPLRAPPSEIVELERSTRDDFDA